ncbi:TPA: hypothetical protein PXS04_003486 [Yersinia enterocolitica]|uniref:hypothetical protein n=1 Tax=Yersinia enterocolitica TaxID=630 RepID=UPI00022DD36E|nr:hypothetical protein [Yersinia enterocolitica]EOR74136.1 hypothetical protein YEP4_16510 [Yersinia enterocolitica subsp. palearctica YE-P4]CCO67807.1 hypothetical protein D322_927 [Yersinia enterocolitica IP 10393]EHB20176.1 hypothetical protein IOK_14355 [Yersinia enterocolitica subsp. palearctica PhRBD_Ye1]EKN3534671.1 hypothetical protein [Yersinia enterocolitica]EKN3641653.1 hypothetical protein [Yersinia enterocolitica]
MRGADKSDAIYIGDEDTFVELFRGDDSIFSGNSNTVYRHYGIDDGHDTIEDKGGESDCIQFINIKCQKIRLKRSGNYLIFWTRGNGKGSQLHYLVTVRIILLMVAQIKLNTFF